MGFKITWLAFHGKSKSDVLYAMRLRDTHVPDEAAESPMCVASFPDDWTVIVLNQFAHPFAEDASLALFSQGCSLIACHVQEDLMFSAAPPTAAGVTRVMKEPATWTSRVRKKLSRPATKPVSEIVAPT